MIFNFSTVNFKKIENEKLDITGNIFSKKKFPFISREPVVVTKEYRCRPDLISKVLYDSEDYADLMMHFNGIQNPFSIEEGMIINVFDLNSMLDCCINIGLTVKPKTLNNITKNQKEVIKSKRERYGENGNVIVQPNENINTNTVNASNGVISLGEGVSKNRCLDGLTDTEKLTEKLRKQIREKIKQS